MKHKRPPHHQPTAQEDELRRVKQELHQRGNQFKQLQRDYQDLQERFASARKQVTGSDRARKSWHETSQRMRDEIERLKGLMEITERRLERMERRLRWSAGQRKHLVFLLSGALYFPRLANFIRKRKIKKAGGRTRDRKWKRQIVPQRARLIGGYRCELCGVRDVPVLGHHIIPHAEGGPDSVDNCQLRCEPCEIQYHQNTDETT